MTAVNVGLGVDGSASNDAGNLLHEARLACFLQRAGGNVAGAVHDARTTGNNCAVALQSSYNFWTSASMYSEGHF